MYFNEASYDQLFDHFEILCSNRFTYVTIYQLQAQFGFIVQTFGNFSDYIKQNIKND